MRAGDEATTMQALWTIVRAEAGSVARGSPSLRALLDEAVLRDAQGEARAPLRDGQLDTA